ncbi:MAG TPA: phenylalanine--tRNA ligase subunit beta [Egibacteraceae bacterium]|nr:phenylalanine--tRNA ligase subunit beta [Egibacteraceae bacterium]
MRVPLSWLHEHVDPGLTPEALAEVLTFGGFEVEGIHRPTAGTRGVTVAQVVSVEPIAGSDKLHLVHAFDGEQTWEIVCGASNFASGDKVAAALPGATLPGGHRIERKRLFGHVSNGMLASARELGIADDHKGIWVLDADAPVGADLSEWLGLDDAVLELAITPDRGYGLSILGLARDVAALTGAALHVPQPPPGPASTDSGVPVIIEDPSRCARFAALRVEHVVVGASPAWLQRRLAAAGMRPISNVVDATNHAMLETGHPAHAYDLPALGGPRIEVRAPRAGETLRTLDDLDRPLDPGDLIIADADGPIGLAGVMGGERTEVGPATSTVLLEVASFDAATVLRTARRHRLFTEASTRFEKTVPPETVPAAAARCAALIASLSGGQVVAASDHYPKPKPRESITLRPERAASLLGLDLDAGQQAALLTAIECEVADADGALSVTPPPYRPDLRIEADLCEEVARLHGYDKIPERVPSAGVSGSRSPEHAARLAVRRALAGGGWSEVLAFPFIADEDLAALGLASDDPRRQTVALVNPLSKEEAVLRTTLIPGLLRILRHNANRQTADAAVFEVGRAFLPPTEDEPGADGGPGGATLPAEPTLLAFAACGDFRPARHDEPARAVDLYDVIGAVDLARRTVGLDPLEVRTADAPPYHPGRAAMLRIHGRDLGVVGELHPRVLEALELPPRAVAGEIRLDLLVEGGIVPAHGTAPSPLPGLRFDVAVVVDQHVPAADVAAAVQAAAGPRLTSCRLFDVYTGPSIGEGRKSLAYSLRLDDPQRQLTDDDEREAIERIEAAVTAQLSGALRR